MLTSQQVNEDKMDIIENFINLFKATKENKQEEIVVGVRINKHLWKAYEAYCLDKGIKYPNKSLATNVEIILTKSVKIKKLIKEEKNKNGKSKRK